MLDDRRDAASLVSRLSYKPGWRFKLGGPGTRFLCVMAETVDSQHRDRLRNTQHMFEVPDLVGWELVRWVFDRLLQCELHEAGEFFQVDGFAPFFPNHQDEGDPYALVERWKEQHNGSERSEAGTQAPGV